MAGHGAAWHGMARLGMAWRGAARRGKARHGVNDQGIEMTEGKHLPFDGGLPTRPDVDLLIKTWPHPEVGQRFTYDAIERLLRISKEQTRFRTITTSWRKRMQEMGVVIECERGEAFFVASADQISASTYGVLKFVGRKAHKHRRKLAVAKVDNDQQRAVIEHQARLMLAVEKDAKKHRMNILPNTAVSEAPKRIEPGALKEPGTTK